MSKITMTISQLQELLIAQKKETAEYITRNLSTYSFYNKPGLPIDIDTTKSELRNECTKSPFPMEFNILNKYLKEA